MIRFLTLALLASVAVPAAVSAQSADEPLSADQPTPGAGRPDRGFRIERPDRGPRPNGPRFERPRADGPRPDRPRIERSPDVNRPTPPAAAEQPNLRPDGQGWRGNRGGWRQDRGDRPGRGAWGGPRPGGSVETPQAQPRPDTGDGQRWRRDRNRDDDRDGGRWIRDRNGDGRPDLNGNRKDRRAWDRNGDGRPDWNGDRDGRRNWDRDRDGRRDWDRNDGRRDWNGGDRGWNGGWDGSWNRGDTRRWDDRGGRGWNRNWRSDNRYDWQRFRSANRSAYRLPRYYAPSGWNYGYRRFDIGATLFAGLFAQNYWIGDPYAYRLPPVEWPYRWVRYYDDALLVDTTSGEVVDMIPGIFW